jgi:hypothetical protein
MVLRSVLIVHADVHACMRCDAQVSTPPAIYANLHRRREQRMAPPFKLREVVTFPTSTSSPSHGWGRIGRRTTRTPSPLLKWRARKAYSLSLHGGLCGLPALWPPGIPISSWLLGEFNPNLCIALTHLLLMTRPCRTATLWERVCTCCNEPQPVPKHVLINVAPWRPYI